MEVDSGQKAASLQKHSAREFERAPNRRYLASTAELPSPRTSAPRQNSSTPTKQEAIITSQTVPIVQAMAKRDAKNAHVPPASGPLFFWTRYLLLVALAELRPS